MIPKNATPEDAHRALDVADQLTALERHSAAILSNAGLPSTWDALMAHEDTVTADSGHCGPIMYRLRVDPAMPTVARFAMTILDRCHDVRVAMQAGDAMTAVARTFDVFALVAGAATHEDAAVQEYARQTLGALTKHNAQKSADKSETMARVATIWNAIRAEHPRWKNNAIANAVADTSGIDIKPRTILRYAEEQPDLFNAPAAN